MEVEPRLRTERAHRVIRLYHELKEEIERRLEGFARVDRSDALRLFEELTFCVMTPQSRARAADAALRELALRSLLLAGSGDAVAGVLKRHGVRFPYMKAGYIVRNRALMRGEGDGLKRVLVDDPREAREGLVRAAWGLGYKEASHFLRNIGYRGLAILDRHVLRGMAGLGALEGVPKSLSRRQYLLVEERFLRLAWFLGIPPEALDMVLWYEKTGEVFK